MKRLCFVSLPGRFREKYSFGIRGEVSFFAQQSCIQDTGFDAQIGME